MAVRVMNHVSHSISVWRRIPTVFSLSYLVLIRPVPRAEWCSVLSPELGPVLYPLEADNARS